jgi:hypothetical protein
MRCNIVLDDRCKGGILEKMAHKLDDNLNQLGAASKVTNKPNSDANLNHFMLFYLADPVLSVKNSMFITHVDFDWKFDSIKYMMKQVNLGICMSEMTCMRLGDFGIPKNSLCYIPPAHDALVSPRKIKIGITSNLYDDGRKREWMLLELSKEIWARNFQFEIYGKGWARVAAEVRSNGVEVNLYEGGEDYQKDYADVISAIPYFDYYLYLGLDEGSMGTLDALAAGVPLIITKEGFHLDMNVKIDYPFISYQELLSILRSINDSKVARIEAAKKLSWRNYALKHLACWEILCCENKRNIQTAMNCLAPESGDTEKISDRHLKKNYFRTLKHKLLVKHILIKRYPKDYIKIYLSKFNLINYIKTFIRKMLVKAKILFSSLASHPNNDYRL